MYCVFSVFGVGSLGEHRLASVLRPPCNLAGRTTVDGEGWGVGVKERKTI